MIVTQRLPCSALDSRKAFVFVKHRECDTYTNGLRLLAASVLFASVPFMASIVTPKWLRKWQGRSIFSYRSRKAERERRTDSKVCVFTPKKTTSSLRSLWLAHISIPRPIQQVTPTERASTFTSGAEMKERKTEGDFCWWIFHYLSAILCMCGSRLPASCQRILGWVHFPPTYLVPNNRKICVATTATWRTHGILPIQLMTSYRNSCSQEWYHITLFDIAMQNCCFSDS